MNLVVIRGRLTKDPEVNEVITKVGKRVHVAHFTVAVNDPSRDTQFVDCLAWSNLAKIVGKHLSKGNEALFTGRLLMRTEKQDDGKYRKFAEVEVDEVEFLGTKNELAEDSKEHLAHHTAS